MACSKQFSEERALRVFPPSSVMSKRTRRPSPFSAVKNPSKSSIQYSVISSSTDSPTGDSGRGSFSRLSCYPRNQMKMNHKPECSLLDYERLPPAVRRKMFSSHERLRLALCQYQLSQSPPARGREISPSNMSLHCSPESSRTSSSRGTKFKKAPPAGEFFLSQADAQWFFNLPNSIKRKQFTREERILLSKKCQSVIMDAADGTLFRMGAHANKSCGTLDSSTSTISHEPPSPAELFAGNELFDWRTSFRWMDEGDDLDLRLDIGEAHHPYLDKPLPPTPKSSHSRRRTFSLTGRPNVTQMPLATVSNNDRRYSNQHPSSSRPSISIPPRKSTSLESEAAYYQDPEARLKLRVYLASAQKFDEAVEFGFPATSDPKEVRPATAAGDVLRTFLLQEDGFDDYPPFPPYQNKSKSDIRPSSGYSTSRDGSKPHNLHGHYHVSSPGNREMTLRMTLTRPDLRADENLLYGSKKGDSNIDPLALEPLPPPSDVDLGLGPFDIPPWSRDSDPSLVKKIWRKVKSPIGLRRVV